ncbi:unnamed protein product [Staurois parvus]|uniref:Uncharacterized protein n=1 Tax=Staurois parvus TaxID=386267 RepID=A0ABN9G385_9NEOB|nr:unnamed protein product [Staurois parvus]
MQCKVNITLQTTQPPTDNHIYKSNVVGQAGSVANRQTGYQERAEEWSGIAEVWTGGVRSESGSKDDAGTGAHGKHTPRH